MMIYDNIWRYMIYLVARWTLQNSVASFDFVRIFEGQHRAFRQILRASSLAAGRTAFRPQALARASDLDQHSTALATLLSILRSNFWSEQRQDNVVRSSTAKLKTQLFHSSKVKGVSANAAADLKSIGLSTLAYISVFFTSVGRKL